MKNINLVYLSAILLITSFQPGTAEAQRIKKNVKRILFLGNSITYDGRYVTDIEAWFIARYPKRNIEFINAGLPSETVSGLSEDGHADGKFPRPDLHERLARVLAQTKPDLVLASYGMNDGIYKPFDETRFQKYKNGINRLHDEVLKSGAEIVHLSPPVYDEQKGQNNGYSAVLDRYSDWLLSMRKAEGWKVADVHFPMKIYLQQKRITEPDFYLAADGVHPDDTGHWIMAKQILRYFKQKQVSRAESIDDALKAYLNGKEILRLTAERQNSMKDAWLTATGHKRPGMNRGIPMAQARLKADSINNWINLLRTRKRY